MYLWHNNHIGSHEQAKLAGLFLIKPYLVNKSLHKSLPQHTPNNLQLNTLNIKIINKPKTINANISLGVTSISSINYNHPIIWSIAHDNTFFPLQTLVAVGNEYINHVIAATITNPINNLTTNPIIHFWTILSLYCICDIYYMSNYYWSCY